MMQRYQLLGVLLNLAVSPVAGGTDRAAALQKQIDTIIAGGQPGTIELSGTYNFSRSGLLIHGAKNLTLQPAASCKAPSCVVLLLFSVWPCGESLGDNNAFCRPINFNNPSQPVACKSASGQPCACPDVIWSSGVNISNSVGVTVRGVSIDYSPRALPPATCKPGKIPAPPRPGSPTAQFNDGRKYTYNLFNSSEVVTEDLIILHAPYMAITSFLGEGGHIFRRVSFTPNPKDFNAMIVGKDGLHESDVRVGLQFMDSRIHGTADDFFNFHNTLQLVFRCDGNSNSCLVINPHIHGVPLNTIYGSQQVLSTVQVGDRFSFYPLGKSMDPKDYAPPLLATAIVAAKEEVKDVAILDDVSSWAQNIASDKANGVMAFGDGSDLWNITFAEDVSKVDSKSLASIDSISGSGSVIRNCDFSVTACNLGRTKSSNCLIANTTFSLAVGRNLEVMGLQDWFEGPLYINNVSIIDNTFVGEGPKGSIIHLSKAATNVHARGNKYAAIFHDGMVPQYV